MKYWKTDEYAEDPEAIHFGRVCSIAEIRPGLFEFTDGSDGAFEVRLYTYPAIEALREAISWIEARAAGEP